MPLCCTGTGHAAERAVSLMASNGLLVEHTPEIHEDSFEWISAAPNRPRRNVQVVILALPVVVLAWLAWTHRSMFQDGYIYLHTVQNILAGHGPVFNEGQRVEAFTSPLWTIILALVGFLTPFPLDWIAVVLGILLTLAGTSIAIVGSARLVHRASPGTYLLPLGAVVFVAVSPVWSLASMGLETGLTFFWLGCCLALLVRWAESVDERMSRFGLVVLGLGPLVRPELALDSMVFVGVLLCIDQSTRFWRDRIQLIAWAVAVPVIYQVFRMGYYGVLVANTATAKEASLPRMGRGILYFADFVGPYWLFVPAFVLLLGAYYPLAAAFRQTPEHARNLCALLALPIAGALNAGYITVMGGDYVHARLLIPPFFAACAPVAVVPLARKYVASLVVLPWAIICALSLRSADGNPWSVTSIIPLTGHGQVTPSEVGWGAGGADLRWYTGSGIYVQFGSPNQTERIELPVASGVRRPTVATSEIGTESYELGTSVDILDLLGLADPLTAHLALARRGVFTGHEKPLPTPWIAALLTANGSSTTELDSLQDERPNSFTPVIPVASGRQLQIETAWARAALQCPAIHDLEYSPSRPLTVGSFISNIFHSFGRTEIRIPPDPESAYHRFCGPGTPLQVKSVTTSD
jgi:arabinofuranosyltransferase